MSEQHAEGSPPASPARPRRGRALLVLALIALLAASAGAAYWLRERAWESTDDAYIDGDVVVVSPRVAGVVASSNLCDNCEVEAGALLVELDREPFEVRVARARASVATAERRVESARAALALAEQTTQAALEAAKGGVAAARATLARRQAEVDAAAAEARRAAADVKRYRKLSERADTSRQRLDLAEAAAARTHAALEAARRDVAGASGELEQARARLREARAAPQQLAVRRSEVKLQQAAADVARSELAEAQLALSYTRIRAPHSGRVTRRTTHVGATVAVGQRLALIVYGKPWVTANFKETQLTRMRPGQPVEIEVDAHPDQRLHGHVDSMQAGTGARFALLPAENATGNFVKVVQRVPVKIVLDSPPAADFLALGMSVVPRVRVGAPPLDFAPLRWLAARVDISRAAER